MSLSGPRHVFMAAAGAPAAVLSESSDGVRWSTDTPLADQSLLASQGMRAPEVPRSADIRWYLANSGPLAVTNAAAGWSVRSRVGWTHNHVADADTPTPGVKMISFVKRRDDISPQQFDERYRNHIAVAREHHGGMWQYVQSVVVAPLTTDAPPIDGMSELWFRSADDFRNHFYTAERSPDAVREDTSSFIDYAGTFSVLATETLAPAGRAPNESHS